MSFAHPQWLNALFLVPALAALFLYGARRRRRSLVEFTGDRLAESLAPGRNWRKALSKAVLRAGGYSLLVIALAGPQLGSQLVKVERVGIDLVIALDTSTSMLAEDMKPNRLERAKQEIVDFIQGLKGDRVGIVVFAGDAFALCPLTVDYDAALMLVQTADVDVVSEPGTALERAIEKSAALFPQTGKTDRVIILVTDGEGHEGDAVAEAKKAAEKDIRVYTIGIGNPSGDIIPLRGTDGSIGGYKKDDTGETVLTRLDEKTLEDVARSTGGRYFPATREGLELKVLYREISGMEQKAIKGEFLERKKDRFAWFLAGAFLLLGLDVATLANGSAKKRGKGRVLHTGRSAAILIVVLAFMASPAAAAKVDGKRVKSGNQYYRSGEYEKALVLYKEALGDTTKLPEHAEGVTYNEANTFHMMNRYPEALGKYHESVSEDTVQTGRMLYNRGNTLSKMGNLSEAAESYMQALRYLPDDADARHNLELALRMMQENKEKQEQQQQQQNSGENKQGENENDQEQQQQKDQQQNQEKSQSEESRQQAKQDSMQTQPSRRDSTGASPELPESTQTIRLSREDALRLLKLLEEQEKELQKEKRKAAFVRVPRSGKDW